jgi:hypothetical protein
MTDWYCTTQVEVLAARIELASILPRGTSLATPFQLQNRKLKHREKRSMASSGANERSIKIGLDFGTHASGFAISIDDGKTTREFSSYPDQPTPYPKTLTAMLYEAGFPIAWGWSAYRRYLGLTPQQKASGKFVYLERFKLALHEDPRQVKYVLPEGYTAVQVIADYLEFLYE